MTKEQPTKDNSGCGGCGITLVIFFIAAVVYVSVDNNDFYLMPGEANMSVKALQTTFDEIDRIVPDSLIITDDLDPYAHYSSAESFGNLFYGLNPVLDAVSKTDTSRKYRFQYVARVDHVDANEFVIRDFLVDSIWRYEPFQFESENPFIEQ
jgi:hypothetical protein